MFSPLPPSPQPPAPISVVHTYIPSSAYFLSQNSIAYDGTGLEGNSDEILQCLITLNKTRSLGPAGILIFNTYHTPNFVAVPTNPNSFDPEQVTAEREAIEIYSGNLTVGNVVAAHMSTDKINNVRMVKSGPEWVCASDFEIIAHQNSRLGRNVRWLKNEQTKWQENGNSDSWFFTPDSYNKLMVQARGPVGS